MDTVCKTDADYEEQVLRTYVQTRTGILEDLKNLGASEEELAKESALIVGQIKAFMDSLGERSKVYVRDECAHVMNINEEIKDTRRQLENAGIDVSGLNVVPFERIQIRERKKEAEAVLHELLTKLAEARDAFDVARTKEIALCQDLRMTPTTIERDTILPPKDVIELVNRRVMEMEFEKKSRNQMFHAVHEKIVTLLDNLKEQPADLAERNIVEEVDIMNPQVLENAYSLHARLDRLRTEREKYQSLAKKKLGRLWDLLDVDQVLRDHFWADHCSLSSVNIKAMDDELLKLTTEAKTRAKELIPKLRDGILARAKALDYGPNAVKELEDFLASVAGSDVEKFDILNQKKVDLEEALTESRKIRSSFHAWKSKINEWNSCLDEKKTEQYRKNRGGAVASQVKLEQKIGTELLRMTDSLREALAVYEEGNKTFIIQDRTARDILAEEVTKGSFPHTRLLATVKTMTAAGTRSRPPRPPANHLQVANRSFVRASEPLGTPLPSKLAESAVEKTEKMRKPDWQNVEGQDGDAHDAERRPPGPGGFVGNVSSPTLSGRERGRQIPETQLTSTPIEEEEEEQEEDRVTRRLRDPRQFR